jgi:hypothetical protein
MFEKRLEELSKKIGEEKTEIFYILTHKRTKREVYFKNNSNTIKFIKTKFKNSLKKDKFRKKFAYFLIKLRLLQPFLRKIKLSSKLGDVIFVGGQIKGFDLSRKEVISFPLREIQNKDFLKSKKFQKRVAKKGFAPEIFEINEEFPFSREELLEKYSGGKNKKIFEKLLNYYKTESIKEITLGKYLEDLKSKLEGRDKQDIKKLLGKVYQYPKNTKIKIAKIHGDFSSEQVLLKNDVPVFTDWNPQENLLAIDLIKFFRGEKNFLESVKFKELLKIYPEDVQKNIKLYVLLSEIDALLRKERNLEVSKYRIEEILGKI